jgi:hypothetical protein
MWEIIFATIVGFILTMALLYMAFLFIKTAKEELAKR